eukprot:scaffold947_cov375-Prasinococcus_capsulatus_cf.AAC.9
MRRRRRPRPGTVRLRDSCSRDPCSCRSRQHSCHIGSTLADSLTMPAVSPGRTGCQRSARPTRHRCQRRHRSSRLA